MIYVLIIEILIKYVCLNYSFENVKVLINKELPKDFFGNIFLNPDSFYINKINKVIIENNKNIPHFPDILNNYNNDYIFHDIFKVSIGNKKTNVLIISNNNEIKIFLLDKNEKNTPTDFCTKFFDKKEKIIKILYLEDNTLAILFSTKDLILYKFSISTRTTRNLIEEENSSNCFLDKIYTISKVKNFFKLSFASHIFVVMDFYGKTNFYNLRNYFMNRFRKFEIIKSIQLGFYNEYFFAEIGLKNRYLLVGYDNQLALIRIGGRTRIKKIYFLNNEIVTSIYTLDNYQILLGTNKGDMHLISIQNSFLNFDGVIHICNKDVNLIVQEKENYLICIKCGNKFKLVDLNGKFNENEFDNNTYIEFIILLFSLLILLIIKILREKISSKKRSQQEHKNRHNNRY